MYLTHSFVAIKRGGLNYLMFYITEDYIEQQVRLKEQLDPLLAGLGRDLLDKGAVVKAFDRDVEMANRELTERFDQNFTRDTIVSFGDSMERPGLLIVNSDIDSFDPRNHKWLYISFKDFLQEDGSVKVFKIQELFSTIADAVRHDKDVFGIAQKYLKKGKTVSAHKMIELKPGMFGISLDLKEAFNFFKQLKSK